MNADSIPLIRATQTTVLVEGLRVEALVGHLAPERRTSQPIDIDIACTLADPEVSDEKLVQTFDYVPVLNRVRDIASSHSRRLIETLAEEIARECFTCLRVTSVVVSVRKPNKFPGVAAVGVTRIFEREV